MSQTKKRPQLNIRLAVPADAARINALLHTVYGDIGVYPEGMLLGQMSNFPEGQFIVEYEDEVVGWAACFIVDDAMAHSRHTWVEITGSGYASRHDPKGDWLYGMEICVSKSHRRLRIGQRLYNARKELCERLNLKGIVFGGRMPSWKRHRKAYPEAESYLEAVVNQQVNDPVIRFQTRMGFEPTGLLPNYLPSDTDSGGYAVHMMWRNPYAPDENIKKDQAVAIKEVVRVATVQFQMRRVASFEEFVSNIEYFVDVTSDYRCDFVIFPELFTLQLLALEERRLTPAESIEQLTRYTEPFTEAMRKLAVAYNINIIGGSHPTMVGETVKNVAYVFLRDGSVHAQNKIHPTPNERHWWNISGGDKLSTIQTDCGPIGVLICYDSEFPELARKLANEGACILFVPFCTDNRQSYLRVRYCAQARAIENQCYVVMSGNVGNLPGVENMDIQYAESAILTPCDFPFARDGIAAECTENVETVAVADLDLSDLRWARVEGTVRNLRDRRFDLYRLDWFEK